MKGLLKPFLFATLLLTCFPSKGYSKVATEEQFHELFITAGYSTAFGAALGAAFLGLANNPSGKLHYVAVGASLGFIGGSLIGSYLLISPILGSNSPSERTQVNLLSDRIEKGPILRIVPVLNETTHRIDQVGANWVLASF